MRDLVITLLMIGVLPYILVRPYIGIYLWHWIALMNPHKLSWGFAASFPFAQLVAIVTLLSLFNGKYRKPIPWNPGLVLMLMIWLYSAVTCLVAWDPEEAWAYWLNVTKIFLFAYLTTMLVHGRDKIKILVWVIAFSVAFYGVKGGVFSILTGGEARVWGPPGNAMLSSNNYLGMALVMVLPLLVEIMKDFTKRWQKYLMSGVIALSAVGTVLTYSRGALLGLVVVIFVMTIRSAHRLKLIILAVPLIAVGLVMFAPEKLTERAETIETYEQDASAMQRIRAWQAAWYIALESPFSGAGFAFESQAVADRWFSYLPESGVDELGGFVHVAHSSYFQILGTQGFVAFFMFMFLLFFMLYKCQQLIKRTKKTPDKAWIANYAKGIQIGTIGYMVSGAFLNAAFFDLVYAFVAIIAMLSREYSASETATPGKVGGRR